MVACAVLESVIDAALTAAEPFSIVLSDHVDGIDVSAVPDLSS